MTSRQDKTKGVADKRDDLKKAVVHIAKTPQGQTFLKWLMKKCLWKDRLLGFSAEKGVISRENTEYNVARRDVWMDIRAVIPWDLLNSIEMEEEIYANESDANASDDAR